MCVLWKGKTHVSFHFQEMTSTRSRNWTLTRIRIAQSLLTTPFRTEVVEVLDVLPTGLDVLVDDVRGNGANLDQTVVLDENRLAGQVSVSDRRRDSLVEVTMEKRPRIRPMSRCILELGLPEGVQDLRAPPPPGLERYLLLVLLGLPQKVSQRSRGHVLGDEDELRKRSRLGMQATCKS